MATSCNARFAGGRFAPSILVGGATIVLALLALVAMSLDLRDAWWVRAWAAQFLLLPFGIYLARGWFARRYALLIMPDHLLIGSVRSTRYFGIPHRIDQADVEAVTMSERQVLLHLSWGSTLILRPPVLHAEDVFDLLQDLSSA